ncbi:MAG TPA: YihY/virulence factor BrkB family protein [Gemmatimonadaceae bacterium]|nr:YihY/virulence factor BrkB family protein [Gemmatimonadaceae bacterium]
MAQRPLHLRVYWTLRDYAKRVWDNSGEDNIFFLAGGIAFNILLAAVPFFLLLITGVTWILRMPADASSAEVTSLVNRLLPSHPATADNPLHSLVVGFVRARGAITLYGAIGFVWFSTRLFGSLRSVLAEVFDIDSERGIIKGKIFDIQITIVATLLFAAYSFLSAYLAAASTRGARVLVDAGLRESVMGRVEYWTGRTIAFVFVTTMFWALYKFLPIRRVRTTTALLAATFTSVLFELARNFFMAYVGRFNPASLYSGTLYAVVIVVVWVYFAALIFILGGEVAQVYELRRVRRRQRETFEDERPQPALARRLP